MEANMSHPNSNIFLKIKRIFVITFLSLVMFHFGATSLLAQRVVCKVTVVLQQLPINLREEMAEFYSVVENYINGYDWVEDDQGGELRMSIQFLLMDASIGGETRFRANLVITNEKDIQYFDKRCHFAYQKNEQLNHNQSQLGSLTALIDYYVCMILGNEFDKLSRFGGDYYFKLAQDIASQGRFGLGQFTDGWDLRQEDIRQILSDDYRDFRLMKDVFFYGVYLYDDMSNPERGRKYLAESVKMMERGIKKQPKIKEKYDLFINAYSNIIVQAFKDVENANDVFEAMIRLDGEHQDTYEPYLR
jgi:hypothetical protein